MSSVDYQEFSVSCSFLFVVVCKCLITTIDSLMKISDSALEQMNIYPKGTLLLVTRSGILRHTLPIAILGDEATVNQDIKTISCHFPNINRYLYYAIKAQEQVILEQYHKDGTTVDSIDFDKFKKLPIPLPPIEEQSRIIAEINRLFALVDTIENNQTDLESTIAQTKSKILDLAIHGKLVPQDPNDEPVSELLKRINPAAEITCDNGQYGKMPEGWCETILGELFEHNTGKALNSSNQGGVMRDYLTTSNVYWDTFDLSVVKQMLFKENELEKCTVVKGDLLVCEGGDVGRAAIWNQDYDICIQNHLHRLRPKAELSVRFYYHVLKYLKDNNMIGGKGIGLLGLSSKELHKLPFPLPPYNEQHRIVAKIEELFTSLDNIQKALEV